MRTIFMLLGLAEILATCLVGACAALCCFKRIDDYCERKLKDTDGQPEK